jgi:hypothetical protein
MSLLGFSFIGLKVIVTRPGYRIDRRTIKRGFRLVNLITSLRVLNPLHTLHLHILLFIGVALWEVLDIVNSFQTSPSSSQRKFICIFYCVFVLRGFIDSLF